MPVSTPRPIPENVTRRKNALYKRHAAVQKAESYPRVATRFNGDEASLEDDGYALSFTKGLSHAAHGILREPAHYEALVEAINRCDATDFMSLVRGISEEYPALTRFSGDGQGKAGDAPTWRGWESPRTGHYYDLQGPDSDAVGMPPAPGLTDDYPPTELTAEMAEVYALALLRDIPFAKIAAARDSARTPSDISIKEIIDALSSVAWYAEKKADNLSLQQRRRRAARFESHDKHDIDKPPNNGQFDRRYVFRGSAPGAMSGPHVSQFMLQGTQMDKVASSGDSPAEFCDATIGYGSQQISQKVAFFPEAVDYMIHWNAYLDVQNGANFGASSITSSSKPRFIDTPRDLATYVRFDQLYQAYLNACLFMLGSKTDGENNFKAQQPVDRSGSGQGPGFPDRSAENNRQAFASFGGPHVLTLVTEVATRCLKAVRRQKFNYHRRARPERLGALLTLNEGALGANVADSALCESTRKALGSMRNELVVLLKQVNAHNKSRRSDNTPRDGRAERADRKQSITRSHADPHLLDDDTHPLDPEDWNDDRNYLLPMAFAEGSPMHPSYGAGHATVAGGCVTMLKAFFHTVGKDGIPEPWPAKLPVVEVQPDSDGQLLQEVSSADSLTIAGELNKLAANISIGRNMAGVHFYTDYYESLRMGERVATGMLIEQLALYDESVEMDFTSFDGDHVHLLKPVDDLAEIEVVIRDPRGNAVSFDTWWTRHLTDAAAKGSSSPGGYEFAQSTASSTDEADAKTDRKTPAELA